MLRDYQIECAAKGLAILNQYKLVYLAMEVRTGKTVTSLQIASDYGARKALFLTKKKAIKSIEADFIKLQASLARDMAIYATNYEQVHNLLNEREKFDLIILDEAHSLGAFPAPGEIMKVVRVLAAGKPIIFLSGTPTPESFSQIFHQLHCSSFSPFGEYRTFYQWAKAGYVHITQRFFGGGPVNDYKNADGTRILREIDHLFVRYTQAQAGFTQAVQEHVLTVKMKAGTYKLAETLRSRRVFQSSKSRKTVIADTEVKLMQKLHQVYSGSVILDYDDHGAPVTGKTLVECFDHSKAEFIKEYFKGRKIAIFYKFTAELLMLQWAFPGMITDSPEVFNQSHDKVFASQMIAGREGTNLSTADALVFFNIDFSHLTYLQARARMQTLEQQKACEMYWVFAEGGIEEKILERVRGKEDYQLPHFRTDFKVEPVKKVA